MPASTVDPIYVPFQVTTAAGTLPAAPQATALVVPDGTIEELQLVIPPGHRGQTGFALFLSGQQVLPWSTPAAWIIGDDERPSFALNVKLTGLVTVQTYNTGSFPHTHYGRLRVRQLDTVRGVPQLRVIPNDQLSTGAA